MADDEIDLLVVGAGPTGIAALVQAGLEGIRAVAIDPGPGPAASVRQYLNGLVLISRPTDYEIAGIPLDCRDPNQLTREEVLHYLGRVVNYRGLHIRAGEGCRELVPGTWEGDPVVVRTSRGRWRAHNVIVTAWYRRRPPPESFLMAPEAFPMDERNGVRVIEALHDGVEVAGAATVILGGGLSAFEQATAVMMHGQAVTIVSRHPLPRAFRTAHFEALLVATGSSVVEQAAEVRLGKRSLRYRSPDGDERAVPCEALVLCLGQEVDLGVLDMLVAAGLLTDAEVAQVLASPTPDSMIRHGRTIGEAITAALQAWPDFRSRLIGGVGGIRLAGGGLHIGGAHSGVKVSIHTAEVAVRDIAGRPLPPHLAPAPAGQPAVPLPMALARYVQLPPAETAPELLGPLRPLRITSWTRTTMALRSRDSFESAPQPAAPATGGPSPYLLAPQPDDPRVGRILAQSDGSNSVSEIARRLRGDFPGGVRQLAGPLRFLWQNNALTWLPPARGAAQPDR
ncbi:MAG: NAD(P)-binding domain-containing protein [Actinomycetota bacterium]